MVRNTLWHLWLAASVLLLAPLAACDYESDTIVDEGTDDDDDATGVDDDAMPTSDDDDAASTSDDDDDNPTPTDDDDASDDDDTSTTGGDDDNGTTATADDDDDNTTGDDDDDDTTGDDDDDDDDACPPLDTTCGTTEINVSGVCVPNPDTFATVFGGTAAPNLRCYDDPGEVTEGPATAQLISCLNVFGLPDNTDGCDVEIFYAVNGNAGESIGKATAIAVDGSVCENKGQVTIDNVPTNTHLLFKATCDGFRDTWQFNQYIPASAVVDGKADSPSFASNIIADSTWWLVPGFPGGYEDIWPSGCRILGQVQDCNENPIANATVEVFGGIQNRELVTYFAGERPDPNRNATDASATYALVDVVGAEGGKLHRVAAAVKLDSGIAPAGAFDVSCYPDAATIITFDGYKPNLNPICTP